MISNTNLLEFRHLAYFLTLAQELHFGRAAERLHITQSALSQQIKQLETILGQEVFARNNKKIQLTDAGQLLLREASFIRNRMKLTLENLELQKNGAAGSLKIGFVASAMESVLGDVLLKLNKSYPRVSFSLFEMSNQLQMREISDGNMDIGFVRTNQIEEMMEVQCVHRESFVLVLPKDHPVTQRNFRSLVQFKDESFILFPNDKSPLFYQQIINKCTEHGFFPRITHRTIHAPTIFYLVKMHMGISIIPESLAVNEPRDVRFISLEKIPYRTSLFAVWNRDSNNPSLPYLVKMLPNLNRE
jgi:DNA-binding transcriptional LysR family regulator